jgi:hypothetical protein
MLRGRRQQCGALDGLLAEVRAGHSGARAVRSEPGIGKTALLGYGVLGLLSDVAADQSLPCLILVGHADADSPLTTDDVDHIVAPIVYRVFFPRR